MTYRYQVGGSLGIDTPSYVKRKADDQLYQALKRGEFCYILNTRQMGKSSMMVRAYHLLQQEGYRCMTVDMSYIGSENITPLQWYKGVVADLWRGFHLSGKVNLKSWWREEEEGISLLQLLNRFIEDILLVEIPQDNIVIFIDEIDSIKSLDFAVDDFFALLRACYNRRAINPEYNRLTFAIFGVATPSDLIADKNRTPFNIGTAIELHGFQLEEVQPLVKGLKNTVCNPEAILKEILAWTGGQPFLTQKVCQLCLNAYEKAIDNSANQIEILPKTTVINEEYWIKQLVHEHIIHNWESQDEPQHLRTISDRILRNEKRAGRMLSIYQLLLLGVQVKVDESREQIELLLSGLVVKQQGYLHVTNRIYQKVFNTKWVEKQLRNLRPYSQAFDAWVASKQTDESRLLRGQALRDAQAWAQGKSVTDLDYQFLAASQELDRKEVEQALEAKRLKEVEARLTEERKRLAQEKKTAKLQRFLLLVVSIGLLVSIGLGVTAFIQYQNATISEIKAIATSSEALFASNRKLDALVQAIKAKQRVQKLGGANANINTEIESVLRQAVYGAAEYNRLTGHNAAVTGIHVSPDGQTIASASDDNTVKLWKSDGHLVRTLKGHGAGVWDVAFSPDGQTIASASRDKTVKLWKPDGTLLMTLKGHDAAVIAVVFSPDGQTIASASWDSTIKLWKTSDGHLVRTLKGHSAGLWDVMFSPDGKTIASASEDSTLKLWSRDGVLQQTLTGHPASVGAIAFSPDGTMIVSAGDGAIKLWTRDGKLLTTLNGHSASIEAVKFSPDGKTIASASLDGTVKLWRRDGILLRTLSGHTAGVWDIDFSPNGSTLASSSWDKTIKLWKLNDSLLTTLNPHNNAGVYGVDFSPDGKMLATASIDNTARLWTRDKRLLRTFKGHNAGVWKAVFSPDGKAIATAGVDNIIKLWRTSDGGLLATFKGHSAPVRALDFSPDGQIIASAGEDNTIKLWSQDGEPALKEGIQRQSPRSGDPPPVLAPPQATGEPRRGTLLKTLKRHDAAVRGISFSSDGNTIASASLDGTVKLWKRDGTLVKTFKGHTAGVWDVHFSPDAKILASASIDNTVKLWREDGTLLKTLYGHTGGVRSVHFSSNGKLITSGGDDNTLKLWKRDGTLLATLYGHSASVWQVAFSPDGSTIASAGHDNTVIFWDLNRILNLDELSYGCDWVRDYMRTNAEVTEEDRHLCDKYR